MPMNEYTITEALEDIKELEGGQLQAYDRIAAAARVRELLTQAQDAVISLNRTLGRQA